MINVIKKIWQRVKETCGKLKQFISGFILEYPVGFILCIVSLLVFLYIVKECMCYILLNEWEFIVGKEEKKKFALEFVKVLEKEVSVTNKELLERASNSASCPESVKAFIKEKKAEIIIIVPYGEGNAWLQQFWSHPRRIESKSDIKLEMLKGFLEAKQDKIDELVLEYKKYCRENEWSVWWMDLKITWPLSDRLWHTYKKNGLEASIWLYLIAEYNVFNFPGYRISLYKPRTVGVFWILYIFICKLFL